MPGQEAGGEPGVKRGLWVALWTAQTFPGGSEVLCPHPYEIKQLKDGRSIPRPWAAVPASQEMRRTCRLPASSWMDLVVEGGSFPHLDPAVFEAPG